MVFKHLLLVVLAASLLRLLVWTAYEIFEWRSGNIVLHEEIDEFALLIMIDLLVIPLLVYLLMRITRSVTRPLTEIAKSPTRSTTPSTATPKPTRALPASPAMPRTNSAPRSAPFKPPPKWRSPMAGSAPNVRTPWPRSSRRADASTNSAKPC